MNTISNWYDDNYWNSDDRAIITHTNNKTKEKTALTLRQFKKLVKQLDEPKTELLEGVSCCLENPQTTNFWDFAGITIFCLSCVSFMFLYLWFLTGFQPLVIIQ